ncbi:hypothetical protein [Winogradskyella sp. A3E31]|uniref:hypothetical protein n=1 Tax=Winogradskyella sp. A3E31 TaxID=3349637 RepID=UPI00398B619A
MALFKIFKDKSGQFRVFIKLNNRIEFISISRTSRHACLELIKRIKNASKFEKAYIQNSSDCGSVYFSLKDIKKEVFLGDSISYVNNEILKDKIATMQKFVIKAKIDLEEYSI